MRPDRAFRFERQARRRDRRRCRHRGVRRVRLARDHRDHASSPDGSTVRPDACAVHGRRSVRLRPVRWVRHRRHQADGRAADHGVLRRHRARVRVRPGVGAVVVPGRHGPVRPAERDIWGGGEWAAPGAVRTCRGDDPDIELPGPVPLGADPRQDHAVRQRPQADGAHRGAGQHLVPDAILNGDVYVYFSDSVYQPPSDRVVRFHWDRVAVNPSSGLTASPTCTAAAPCG